MRKLLSIASLSLAACGGGFHNFDAVTHVSIEKLDPQYGGYATWDKDGNTHIFINAIYPATYHDIMLEHEIWHILTRLSEHLNESADCISNDFQTKYLEKPCEAEVEQVIQSGLTMILDFPDDVEASIRAANWWNQAVGYEIIKVIQ